MSEKKSGATGTAEKSTAGSSSENSSQMSAASAQREVTEVTIKSLLDAGAHFGHQTDKWNPKMLPFIYCERNDIHIINLNITLKLWQRARKYVVDTVSRGGGVLVVATKQQLRDIVERESSRSGMYYVTRRWLGGTLTNFETIKNSIDRMRKLEDYLSKSEKEDSGVKLKKKEKLAITKELDKLNAALGGIRLMRKRPDLIFVVDIYKEAIAVAEARRLHIPVIALVDTNVDPSAIQFPVPSNDDSTRTVELFLKSLADAVAEGKSAYDSRRNKEEPQSVSEQLQNGHAPAVEASAQA